jgi:methylthioribose-1-phosphate isomerase
MARPDEQDTSRRDFFRTFGREAVRQAGAVAGAAAELRRSSMAAARGLLDEEPAESPTETIDEAQPEAAFRSAYRFTGTELVVLDARQLPRRVQTISLTQPSEVASAMRAGAINGGPVLGEVGAYAMALAARAAVARPDTGRVQQMRAAANTLRAAKPQIRALAWAVDRLEALYLELAGQGTDPTETADRLQSEADSIASANTGANAEIGRSGAATVLALSNEPLNLLVHGDMGPLSCGMVGMGTALIQDVRDRGREVHVWLTEAAPSGEGGRVAAFQLRQLDVPYTVVPDSALGWVFNGRHIDAVLLRGDEIAGFGDCGVLVGGLAAAAMASVAKVPVYILAPTSAISDARYGSEFQAVETELQHARVAPGVTRFSPTMDVVSPDLITRVISETSG